LKNPIFSAKSRAIFSFVMGMLLQAKFEE